MSSLVSRHAIDEFFLNIRERDLIKARLVLDSLTEIDDMVWKRVLYELHRCDNSFAIPLLAYLLHSQKNLIERYPVLQDTLLSKGVADPEVVIDNIRLAVPGWEHLVRLAGQLQLQRAAPSLIKVLQESSSIEMVRVAIEGLGMIGMPESVEVIAPFMRSNHEELLVAAVQALGRIYSPEAIEGLADGLGVNDEADLLILDIFAESQDDLSLQKLNETLLSTSSTLRCYGMAKLADIGCKAVPMLAANLFVDNKDLQILSLNVLKDIGDTSAAQAVRNLINTQPQDANVRFAAYETLAGLPVHRGDYVLANGLVDPEGDVRLAAARAIDGDISPELATGLKNMLNSRDEEAVRIIKAIIDAQAGNIFRTLLGHEFFIEVTFAYLAQKAHPAVLEFYRKVLKQQEQVELAARLSALVADQTVVSGLRLKICAVDDSPLILRIYRSMLTELGYESVLFEKPAEAIAWLEKEKPHAICSDLNMPAITGIELTRIVRRQYSRAEVPIIMVTTQGDVESSEAAQQAGVNEFLQKPFDLKKLGDALHSFTQKSTAGPSDLSI